MQIVNTPKLVFAIVAVCCVTALMALGRIDTSEGLPFLTMIAGYILGNGVAAKNGDPVAPVIGTRYNDGNEA